MNNTINGRTPEEIKKGLECCSVHDKCDKCPYDGMPCNDLELERDALAYIQQLERERDEAWEIVKMLNAQFETMVDVFESEKRKYAKVCNERDAAVELTHGVCMACIHYNGKYPPGDIMSCCKFEECLYGMDEWDAEDHWQWRGVQEVE